ncbi:hypothetical protein ACP70R_041573 [Stipagrostis hirtigluma subsp. patula]
MLQLRKHLGPLLREASHIGPASSPLRRGALLLSTTSPTPAPFSLEAYLVAACGLAPAQARIVSQKAFDGASKANRKPFKELSYSRLNSASNPDAVLAVLSDVGLSRADIAAVVAADPLLLRCAVRNIGPRLLALRDRIGLSPHQIRRFLLVGSRAFRGGDVGTKLEFLISLYSSFEEALVVVKRNNRILSTDLERVIKPNISLLRQCGLSVREIAQLCLYNPRIFAYNQERLQELVLRAEKFGVPRGSGMFKYVLLGVSYASEKIVVAKLEFLSRTLGCSKTETAIVVSKQPSILGTSEELLLRKIKFLINEVGMEPQFIVKTPVLLALSLEKRLVPRHRVMKVLQTKGLLNSDLRFCTLGKLGEKTFRLRFIDCHKDSVTGLAAAYAGACAGDVPPQVQI